MKKKRERLKSKIKVSHRLNEKPSHGGWIWIVNLPGLLLPSPLRWNCDPLVPALQATTSRGHIPLKQRFEQYRTLRMREFTDNHPDNYTFQLQQTKRYPTNPAARNLWVGASTTPTGFLPQHRSTPSYLWNHISCSSTQRGHSDPIKWL